MTQCPLVSISCLTYNHAPYLRQCLDGFVMQITSFPIEILIYDDASGDGTQNIIEEYQKKYPDIINMMTANCQTSLDNNDILSLGSWAVLKKPEIETLSLPNEPCNAKGKILKRVWYYVYDLEAAKNEIVNFVYNDISPEKDEGK